MEKLWQNIKKDAKQRMGPQEAGMLDNLQLKDVESGEWARKLATLQLGPVLGALGVEDDPLEFFLDLIKVMLFLQLITCGVVFYSTELFGSYDAGEAFRATSGLALGYMIRPAIKIDQLLAPVYNWGVKLFFPNLSYEVTDLTSSEMQTTLNQLGILMAASFLLPQLLLGWDVEACTQLVAPLAVGLFCFDIVLIISLLLKLRML